MKQYFEKLLQSSPTFLILTKMLEELALGVADLAIFVKKLHEEHQAQLALTGRLVELCNILVEGQSQDAGASQKRIHALVDEIIKTNTKKDAN